MHRKQLIHQAVNRDGLVETFGSCTHRGRTLCLTVGKDGIGYLAKTDTESGKRLIHMVDKFMKAITLTVHRSKMVTISTDYWWPAALLARTMNFVSLAV